MKSPVKDRYRATYLVANYFFHYSLKYMICLLLLHKSWFLLFPPIFAVFWAQKCMIRAPLARLHMGFQSELTQMGTSIILLSYSKVNFGNYCSYDQIMSDNRKLIGVHKLSTEVQSSPISGPIR